MPQVKCQASCMLLCKLLLLLLLTTSTVQASDRIKFDTFPLEIVASSYADSVLYLVVPKITGIYAVTSDPSRIVVPSTTAATAEGDFTIEQVVFTKPPLLYRTYLITGKFLNFTTASSSNVNIYATRDLVFIQNIEPGKSVLWTRQFSQILVHSNITSSTSSTTFNIQQACIVNNNLVFINDTAVFFAPLSLSSSSSLFSFSLLMSYWPLTIKQLSCFTPSYTSVGAIVLNNGDLYMFGKDYDRVGLFMNDPTQKSPIYELPFPNRSMDFSLQYNKIPQPIHQVSVGPTMIVAQLKISGTLVRWGQSTFSASQDLGISVAQDSKETFSMGRDSLIVVKRVASVYAQIFWYKNFNADQTVQPPIVFDYNSYFSGTFSSVMHDSDRPIVIVSQSNFIRLQSFPYYEPDYARLITPPVIVCVIWTVLTIGALIIVRSSMLVSGITLYFLNMMITYTSLGPVFDVKNFMDIFWFGLNSAIGAAFIPIPLVAVIVWLILYRSTALKRDYVILKTSIVSIALVCTAALWILATNGGVTISFLLNNHPETFFYPLLVLCWFVSLVSGIALLFLAILLAKIVENIQQLHRQYKKDAQYLDMLLNSKEYNALKDAAESNALDVSLFTISMAEISNLEEIGTGASSIVLRGKWRNSQAAIKIFKGEIDQLQFKNELKLLCSLRHPNLVSIYGAIMEQTRTGYVMEYCSNGSLERMIQRKYEFSLNQKIAILLSIARGMSFLHAKQVIHRDLKCDNVLMNEFLIPKVSDLGISKLANELNSANMTAIIGTSAYMAPEVFNGEQYSYKCDVFSFSIMIFQLLFNTSRPYGSTTFMIEKKVASDEHFRPVMPVQEATLDEREQRLVSIMRQSWKHNPVERPSFDEICEELEKLDQQ